MRRAAASWALLALMSLLHGCAATRDAMPISATPPEAAGAAAPATTIGTEVEREFEQATELLRQGEYQKGVDAIEKLLRVRDARMNVAVQVNRGIAYEKLGKLEQAEEAFKAALAVDPTHPVANNELGMVLRRTGRFVEARAAYEKALESYPGFLPARRNLGILCDLYLRDLECAMNQYRIYAAASPEDKAVAAWIADLEQKLGRQPEAAP